MNELKLDTLKKLSGGGTACGRDKGASTPKSSSTCKSSSSGSCS